MKSLLFLIFLCPVITLAGTVNMNGKSWSCNGSLSVINGEATCNGKPMSTGSENVGPCPGSKVKTHANGLGKIDVLATVSPKASIKGTVCGKANISHSVIIQKGAKINGPIQIKKGAVIGRGSTINGGGVIGRNTTIGKNVTLNGNIQITNTRIADSTTLNGDIIIEGVTLSGGITCSGEGVIRANPSSKAQ